MFDVFSRYWYRLLGYPITKNRSLDVGLIKLSAKKARAKMIMHFKKYWTMSVNNGILSDKAKTRPFSIFPLMTWGKVRWFKKKISLKVSVMYGNQIWDFITNIMWSQKKLRSIWRRKSVQWYVDGITLTFIYFLISNET